MRIIIISGLLLISNFSNANTDTLEYQCAYLRGFAYEIMNVYQYKWVSDNAYLKEVADNIQKKSPYGGFDEIYQRIINTPLESADDNKDGVSDSFSISIQKECLANNGKLKTIPRN